MIYIAYAVSGPLKRVFIDALMYGFNNVYGFTAEEAKRRINKKGMVRCEPEQYDGFEVVPVNSVELLIKTYGEDYCYQNEDTHFGVDKDQIEESVKLGLDHFVICNHSRVINNVKRDFGDKVKLLHITFKNYQNVLDATCPRYNDDVNERRRKIDIFNRELEESDIQYDVDVEVDNSISNNWTDLINTIWEALKGKVDEKYFYWYNLLNTSSFGENKNDDDGLRFEKDYSNVINSSAFRRLQDKAQVFPLEKYDYVRTRLTHSLECSTIAEELGLRAIEVIDRHEEGGSIPLCKKIPTLLKTAALLHDMGNPPFGHFGESVIRDWFKSNLSIQKATDGQPLEAILGKNSQEYKDLINFEGNAQLLRLVTKLSMANGDPSFGLDLTFSTLSIIIKYPVNSNAVMPTGGILSKKKLGYFSSETDIYREIQKRVCLRDRRHPLTFLLEAADDIAYLTSDIQDAHHKGLISISEMRSAFEQMLGLLNGDSKQMLTAVIDALTVKDGIAATLAESLALSNACALLRTFMIIDCITTFDENYPSIMAGEYEKELLSCQEFSEKLVRCIRKLLKVYVYDEPNIIKSEISASRILSKLLETFIPAVLEYDKKETTSLSSRIHILLSENYKYICSKHIAEVASEDDAHSIDKQVTFQRILLATDYVCGMTDSYAKEIYNIINASL